MTASPPIPPAFGSRGGFTFWIAHVAFWAADYAAARLLIDVFRPDMSEPQASVLLAVGLCFLATAAMRSLSHREPLLTRLGVTKAGLIAGGAILSSVAITLVLFAFHRGLGLAAFTRAELVARLVVVFTMLANWCAVYFGYQLIRERLSTRLRAAQAESLALRNELKHLQAQISPHFLFNALNTVVASRDDPEAIETVTQSLANYLRFLLRPAATLEPLSRELTALEDYLTIQGMRFGAALETRIDCDLDARDVDVPPVLVQPLVENAIKYGGRTSPKPLRIHVTARREAAWLTIEVANTGAWVEPGGPDSTGTGLLSLERRLQLLVGAAATVHHREDDGWVRVVVRVPVPQAGRASDTALVAAAAAR